MRTESKKSNATTVLATIGLLMIPALCCALPFLVGAGAVGLLGGLSTAADNLWVTAAAIIIPVVGIVWLLVRRSRRTKASADCCTPQGSSAARDAVDHSDSMPR